MPQSFGESFVEGGVSNIKGLVDAITNLPNADISAIRERAYKLSSDVIKYTTDSQYRDSVNQEVVYDFKTDIAYGQILALQGDADKIGQVVGEASGKLASDLALSVATAGVGKVANQTIKTINKVDGDAITSNIPNNSDGIITLSKSCSFDGSMQVKTLFGYKPISQIQLKDWVFSKNELTGKTNYRQVLQTIKSIDPDTTRITIVNSNGIKQTIISDGLHPYFVDFTGDTTPPKPSTGHHYKGNLPYAYWVGAKDIEIGHRLIDDKGNYQTVIAIHTEATPLNSYNLEVDVDHTFFIKGVDGVDSVWVHNDCYRQLPNGSKKQSDGTYIANVNGKQITLIETKVGNETKYYTPDHKKGDPYRNKAGQAVNEKGNAYVNDPNKLNTDLTRPSLRAETKRLIDESHEYNTERKALDDNGNVIEPPYQYGHKKDWENRRILAAATELGWDQATLNDYINARPNHFELQNDKFNLSHQGENKSLEGLDRIKKDMQEFLDEEQKRCKIDPQTNQCKKP